jgi:pimeloyl-ACP methyl ester carboxylesterase
MKVRKIRSFCFLSALLVLGVSARAQSEPSVAQQLQVPLPTIQVPEQPQQQLPIVQAVPVQLELSVAAHDPNSVANVSASLGRPVLFVHGWCGNDVDWNPTLQAVRTQLMTTNPALYGDPSVYGVFFDGVSVNFYDFFSRLIISKSQISTNARFFVILFMDPRQSDLNSAFDASNVAQIPISIKANELSEALNAIQDVSFVRDSIVLTHSMGGLVARAYVESLGSPLNFAQNTYSPGQTPYFSNVGSVITIDTPHGGAPRFLTEDLFPFLLPCAKLTSGGINRSEMIPGDPRSVIETLNYVPGHSLSGTTAAPIPNAVFLHSIKSYNAFDWGGTPNSDGVVVADTQDIRIALQPNFPLSSALQSLDNNEGARPNLFSADCSGGGFYFLHFIKCVGVHSSTLQFLNQGIASDMLGVPLGVYTLSFANSILGGSSSTGTVTLTTGAPPHGAAVALSSDDASVQVPSNLNIPSGALAANFNMTSSTVALPKTVKITASYGRIPQNASITLQPAMAQVALTATSLNFSTQLIRSTSIGHVLSLTNSGTAPLVISSIVATGDFAQSNTCIGTIAVQTSCAINVVFKPSAFGLGTGTLTISDNAPGSPHTITLSGTGIDIFLTMVRPGRPHRSNAGSSNVREANFQLNVVGANAAQAIAVNCERPKSGEVCTLKQLSPYQWSVAVTSQYRGSRLRPAQVRAVTINASLGNAVRNISVPLIED